MLINGTQNAETLTGGSTNDEIYGLGGSDRLDGGAGADTLNGGAGDDTYVVDNVGDSVIEGSGQGTDTVQSSVDFVLATYVEHLTLTGSAAINGTGNALNNTIIGNGLNNNLSGLDGDDRLDGGVGADNLTGGNGNDIYVVDNVNDTVVETSGEGTDGVEASIDFTLSATVENLTLTGSLAIIGTGNASNNTIIGNSISNNLSGMDGDDRLDGGAGIDTLSGGNGNDTYVVDNSSDVIIESSGQGADSVESSVNYTLPSEVEALTLTGSGAINGTGNDLPNTITGNSGANTLDGGGGADTLNGGYGHDIYVVDNAGDVVIEASTFGTDLVQSSLNYVLPANVENLTLTAGSVAIIGTGNTSNNTIIGNSLNNNLSGLDGLDRLDGGAGADTLTGGNGDDTYVVDNVGDSVIEGSGQGTDTVQSSVDFVLATYVEHLTLTGSAAINGTGNALNNTIIGNGLNNNLSGLDGDDRLDGGVGADNLTGGNGNDIYVVDNVNDTVVETSGEGTDGVEASIDFTLSATVENLTLTGSLAIIGTGNASNNTIIGNSISNNLSGMDGDDRLDGGAGIDTLSGGNGNDTYVVDNSSDVIIESSGQGADSVESSVNYTLPSEVEALTLTGSGAINGTGNDLPNTITGNSGANTLDGGGGADTLNGGYGHDIYVVDNAGDVVIEASTFGTDLVQSSLNYVLPANVENLTLTAGSVAIIGTGNTSNNTIIGNSLNNNLSGLDGLDRLDGGAGADTLTGGNGDDTYVVDNVGDLVIEISAGGTDTVESTITYTLTSEVERLTLSAGFAINGYGNSLSNIISGNSNANLLDGGAGSDTLIGGAGSDTYVVDNAGDVVTELLNGGADLVQSSITYALPGHVENLDLTGGTNINATGNSLQNTIRGNAGNNVIAGGGGTDILTGGLGVDTFLIRDGFAVTVTDLGAGGRDILSISNTSAVTAQCTSDWTATTATVNDGVATINSNGFVVNLSAAIGANGFTINNNSTQNSVLIGTDKNDVLISQSGSDNLSGGSGDDAFVGGGGYDAIFGGDGIDTLRLTGTVANYKVTRIADGYKVVDSRLNGDGTASCYQVEKVFLINSNTTLNLADLANTYAPSSASKTISFAEDSRYTLMSSDFKFLDQDIGQTLEKIIIARLPNLGHIWLDGYIVDLNQEIPIADLNAKRLSYVPPPDKSGKNLATWGFKVHDGFVPSAISYNMTFNVTPINDAPVLDEEIPDQTVLEGSRFTLNVNQNFRDVDSGDQLTLSAALLDGKPLPSWLKFNASTGVFSGTPLDADSNKSLNIVVTATDKLKLKTSDQFSLAITGVNMPPVAKPITKIATATENESFVFVLPFETFTNNELGDALTYSATGLPPGVVINPDTGTLTGRLSFTAADIALRTVTLKATDRYGLVAATDLKMKINNVPTIAGTAAADILVGGVGIDYITGGNGNDTLTGGAGNDQFRFNVLPSLSNKDKILDFTSGTDRLYFDKKIFTSIVGATGQIGSEIYIQQSGFAATTSSQRLIFDRLTCTLYYDVDGNGGLAPLGLVELVGVNNLPITDLFLY